MQVQPPHSTYKHSNIVYIVDKMKITKYTKEHYDKAIKLKKKGYGSLRISKVLGFKSRSAVEEWINRGKQPYYISKKRIKWSNSKENKERIRKLNYITQPKAVKISAQLRTKRLPESAKILSPELAYVLGVVYGDGHVSIKQRRIILGVTDEDFALKFKSKLEKWSSFKARFKKRIKKTDYKVKSRKPQYLCYIDSIEASKFIEKFDLNLIKNSQNIFKTKFIKGFFDSDGCVNKNRSTITIHNSIYNLSNFVSNLLTSLNIKNKIHSRTYFNKLTEKDITMHNISILGEGRKIFANTINSSLKRKQERLARFINNPNKLTQ